MNCGRGLVDQETSMARRLHNTQMRTQTHGVGRRPLGPKTRRSYARALSRWLEDEHDDETETHVR